MKITATRAWIISLICFFIGLWPIGLLGICVALYMTLKNLLKSNVQQSASQDEELERQREIERKEIDMVRKSNDILIHLIQDEHREEDR